MYERYIIYGIILVEKSFFGSRDISALQKDTGQYNSSQLETSMALPIEDYFIIGDLHSAGLISSTGAIHWLCLPHFDSPSIFAKLLDEDGGNFSLAQDEAKVQSRYYGHTAVVEHTVTSSQGDYKLYDYMLPQPTTKTVNHYLIRTVKSGSKPATVRFRYRPRPHYARQAVGYHIVNNRITIRVNEERLILDVPPRCEITREPDGGLLLEYTTHPKAEAHFVMEYVRQNQKPTGYKEGYWHETLTFWREWVAKGKFFDFAREDLIRSAITLKLMQFYPTGAIVAAPTTSLPEEIGGERNWDYRYTWIRDATFTLYAFYVLHYTEEAQKFFDYIERITAHYSDKDFNIDLMYTIWGEPVPGERTLRHLSGYKNSKPVRIGNGAGEQFQLDSYGELLDAFYFASERNIDPSAVHKTIIKRLVNRIETHWQDKDNGLWEMRGGRQHNTYSKVMCAVGVNRALRLKDKLDLDAETITKWETLEKEITQWIWDNCYDKELKTFTQHPHTQDLDAVNYLFVILQFLDKNNDHERTKEIVLNTSKKLLRDDIFVYRYKTTEGLNADGLRGHEGAFLLCSYWMISALAKVGELEKAIELFSKLDELMNEARLLPEEVDPKTGRYLGNYPQAFSHIGLIMSAYYINRYTKKLQRQRS